MIYGTKISNRKQQRKSGFLKFSITNRKIRLTPEEMDEFERWVKDRIFQYGGNYEKETL